MKKFLSKKVVTNIAHEIDGIILSKGRVIDGLYFKETGELGEMNLGSLGVKINRWYLPYCDEYRLY